MSGWRAQTGLPARDVYVHSHREIGAGIQELGASSENITKSQHCRAEVYISGYGWVPVDPADVRKSGARRAARKTGRSTTRW